MGYALTWRGAGRDWLSAHTDALVVIVVATLGQQEVWTPGSALAHIVGGRLQAVEATARRSLAELRRVVGLLGEAAAVPLPPTPGLPGLTALAAQVQAAGVPVDLHVDADPGSLPPDLGEAVYRIVQEALTNVIKHAGPCRATGHGHPHPRVAGRPPVS